MVIVRFNFSVNLSYFRVLKGILDEENCVEFILAIEHASEVKFLE